MLVLSRRVGEEIVIGDNIRVMITAIQGKTVRIGIQAPPTVSVDRSEVHQRRAEFADLSAANRVETSCNVPCVLSECV
ncbi:MAG: carbon storage regulator [Gemmataceae bacterium]